MIPVGADGVQEVVLVISRSGYTPTHFAVKKGVPVRIVFRQLGYVPGGNILLVRWGSQKEQYLDARLADRHEDARVHARRRRAISGSTALITGTRAS